MNRLWVRISIVIVGVVLIVALFPFIYRTVSRPAGPPPSVGERVPFDDRDPETFRRNIERGFWINTSRTLAVGALVAFIAGVLLTRWLIAPLRQLEQGAQAVARGQLKHRVPVKGSTEMRSVAASFNRMATELEHQETLRRQMLADVTHELRHPIHILKGSLQAIIDGVYPLNMEEIDRLLEQMQSLSSLVDDLHELALAEAHELPLEKTVTDLAALILNVTEIFQPLAKEKEVTLSTSLASPSISYELEVDASRIRQALKNLISNALLYTPKGGVVDVSLSQPEGYILITVKDTGVGIMPENLPRVFDRFYRQDSSRNREIPGTGLGLAISQAIVQAHDGQIDVESLGKDQGSTFTITLPMEHK